MKIQVLTDIETLLNEIMRNSSTTENSLMSDVKADRAYNEGIIDDTILIRRKFNIAGAMTKPSILLEFVEALKNNQLHYGIEQSYNRTIHSPTNEKEKARV